MTDPLWRVKHLVEAAEGHDVELAELAQQVEAALQDLLRPNVVVNNVLRDMLEI